MTETLWFMLVLWIVFLAFALKFTSEYMLKTVAALIGFLFSISLMGYAEIILKVTGFGLLLFNVYMLAVALLIEGGK